MVDLCHFGYKITTLLGEGWIFTNCGEGPLVVGLQGISTADDLRAFLHIGDDLRGAIVHQIGDPGPHLRVLAALPPQVIVQSSVSATLPAGDNLTAVQATHVGLLWRTSRKLIRGWSKTAGGQCDSSG